MMCCETRRCGRARGQLCGLPALPSAHHKYPPRLCFPPQPREAARLLIRVPMLRKEKARRASATACYLKTRRGRADRPLAAFPFSQPRSITSKSRVCFPRSSRTAEAAPGFGVHSDIPILPFFPVVRSYRLILTGEGPGG